MSQILIMLAQLKFGRKYTGANFIYNLTGVFTSAKLKRVMVVYYRPLLFQTDLYDIIKAECYDERTYWDFRIPNK